MAYEDINVRAEETRKMGEKLKLKKDEYTYQRDIVENTFSDNGGDGRNGLFGLNTRTEICVNVTKQLMRSTGDFLEKVSEQFEDVDESIAQEVERH